MFQKNKLAQQTVACSSFYAILYVHSRIGTGGKDEEYCTIVPMSTNRIRSEQCHVLFIEASFHRNGH